MVTPEEDTEENQDERQEDKEFYLYTQQIIMFFTTSDKEEKNTVEIVSCSKCKALIEKINPVSINFYTVHYCNNCVPPYNKAIIIDENMVNFAGYTKTKYWGEVEMDVNGIPVGYTKKK